MKTLLILTTLSFSMALALTAEAKIKKHASKDGCDDVTKYTEVSKAELKALVEQKQVAVIDVNSKESFEKNHVPYANHYETIKKDLKSVLPADKNALIVAYCGGPKCTAWQKAAKAACKAGYTNIKHYKGGISGWISAEG